MAISEAQKRATKKYEAENCVRLNLKLNKKTDADILAWLEAEQNVQGYIKSLIRKDIEMATGGKFPTIPT